ncbi:MAG: ABC transporter ATP-binding protein [Candidatus Poribacteria bacterium]|nr:ABC transporter ATP-binding protein [Candidatus Poribacteria bacterium]
MKALELENVSKSYKVVKKLRDEGETHLLGFRNLTKFFLGETFSILGTRTVTSITALDDVSFSIEPGQVVGLFGKNGSGKTTMLSILGGIFPQDSGTVRCFGYDYSTDLYEVRKYVVPVFGWLNAVTWAFTGRQNIEKFMMLHHVPPAQVAGQVDDLAKEIEIHDRLDDRVARYSQGMRVKIQVITAILLYRVRGRSLLLLDEPFIGLDVFSQRYLRDFVKYKMRHENFAMLLATHQPEDIEEICDEVIVIDEGRMVAKDSVDNLRRMVKKAENIQINYISSNGNALPDGFFQRTGVLEHRSLRRGKQIELDLLVEDSREALAWLVSDMVKAGCAITSLNTQPMKFEDVLVKIIEGGSS